MKIALLGYGKMGKAIEDIALKSGHEIVLKISIDNTKELTIDHLQEADVAIEFSAPESAVLHLMMCFDAGVPVICGSTGWLGKWNDMVQYCKEKNGSFLYASNFSIGVNIFFEINRQLARLMSNRPEYDISIEETHHTEKKDAPSGTAISLANGIIENQSVKKQWISGNSSKMEDLGITSNRIDPAPGTHIVKYDSAIDSIEIKHTAHNRQGFAAGALLAAEFLKDKKGIYQFEDVLKKN